MASTPTPEDVELAKALFAEWDNGTGTSKSQIEIREWGDATAHGRRFDRLIRQTLGLSTSRRSKQSDRIGDLEQQVRRLGGRPAGATLKEWEDQLQHARDSALAALRAWNDPTATFRTQAFSLLFVAAWNALAIAILQKREEEWRELDDKGRPVFTPDGAEKALDTNDLMLRALTHDQNRGIRENVRVWTGIRNSVAHRQLPALDAAVIPWAQAGLLNFENTIASEFGDDWLLASALSVPLQLSGFRDPGVLESLKLLQAALPLDVQQFLSNISGADPSLAADPTYMLRVAFLPAVPASGRSPDAVAYFVRPGEMPDELAQALDQFVVLPKPFRPPRPNLIATQAVEAVQARIPYRFTVNMHTEATYRLKVRASPGSGDSKVNENYCEYVSSVKRHLYNQAWVDLLVERLATPDEFERTTGKPAVDADESDSPGG
jgi:hypothetical protein